MAWKFLFHGRCVATALKRAAKVTGPMCRGLAVADAQGFFGGEGLHGHGVDDRAGLGGVHLRGDGVGDSVRVLVGAVPVPIQFGEVASCTGEELALEASSLASAVKASHRLFSVMWLVLL